MDNQNRIEAGQPPASIPIKIPVRFVGGSLDGHESEATFRVVDESMLRLLDFSATFGTETYKYHAEDRTFVLQT